MISQMAKEDAAQLAKEGITLSFDEIVRLNALGLKVERSDDIAGLRRVAWAGGVMLKEPTLGMWNWFERACRALPAENETRIMTAALVFGESNPYNPDVPRAVHKAIRRCFGWRGILHRATQQQLAAAFDFVVYGGTPDPSDGSPSNRGSAPQTASSLSAGMMIDNLAYSVAPLSEIRHMTVSEVAQVIRAKRIIAGTFDAKAEHADASGEYFAALEKIRRKGSAQPDGNVGREPVAKKKE